MSMKTITYGLSVFSFYMTGKRYKHNFLNRENEVRVAVLSTLPSHFIFKSKQSTNSHFDSSE